MSDDLQIKGVQRRLDAIEGKLDRLDEALRGAASNGHRPGILTRLDRLEQNEQRRSRVLWLVVGAAGSLAVTNLWQLILGA
jgi:hypothetical protein